MFLKKKKKNIYIYIYKPVKNYFFFSDKNFLKIFSKPMFLVHLLTFSYQV